jgi:hypothetical protein
MGLRRAARVFIHRDGREAIVVAMHYNEDRIGYEDDMAALITSRPDAVRIGKEVVEALNKSAIRPKNLRDTKLADWPAYRTSGAKSVREFEAEYIQLCVEGANEANVVYVITGIPKKDSELQVTSSVSSCSPPDDLGKRVLRVYQACRDRKL